MPLTNVSIVIQVNFIILFFSLQPSRLWAALSQSILSKYSVSCSSCVSVANESGSAEMTSIKCGTNKSNSKKLQNTPMRSGKFIITMKHFVRSKCDANSVVPCTFYIYVFIFTLPKGKILMIVLLFSLFLFNSFYFYFVCTTYQKHKLGRYFTRMNGPNRTKRNTNGNLNEDLLLIHCTTEKNITRSYSNTDNMK